MRSIKFTYKNSRASTIVILGSILLVSSLWYINIEKFLNVLSINYPIIYLVGLFGGILLIANYSFVIVERFFIYKGEAIITEEDIRLHLQFSKKSIKLKDLYDVDYIEIVPKKAIENIGYRLIIEHTVNVKGKRKKMFLDTPGKLKDRKESELYEIYDLLIKK